MHEQKQKQKQQQQQEQEIDIKQQCWIMWTNEDTHRCFACEKWLVRKTSFKIAYFISILNGGTEQLDNMCPICPECSSAIGDLNLKQFKIKSGYVEPGTKSQMTKAYLEWTKTSIN